jgi:RND family efflux transporter MFP subunit
LISGKPAVNLVVHLRGSHQMSIADYLPQTRRARIVAGALAGVVLLLALTLLMRSRSNESNATAAPVALTVTARTLESTDIARGVIANGTIQPWQEIIVGPEVGGYRVAAVNAEVGDHVRQGQELVRLADDMLAAEVASKRANVAQAQATLENAAAAYRRAQSLSVSGGLSQSDLDRLRTEESGARARVEVSQADLDGAQLRLRHTRVTAPDDGVISARSVNVGQVAQTGSEMMRLLRKGRVEWRAEIPEARVREIHIGQSVRLTTADGTQLQGKVRTVAPTIESATRAGLVYVDIPSSAGAARPGMFARGEILLQQSTGHMAPIASVIIQDGYSYVFVLIEEQTVQRRRVQTGAVQGKLIEIVEGLQVGERIVDKGAGFLKDGDRVSVVIGDAGDGKS